MFKKRKANLLWIGIFLILCACNNHKTTFTRLNDLSVEGLFLIQPENVQLEKQRHEYVVVSNPPKNIKGSIEQYMSTKVDKTFISKRFDLYSCQFYKETSYTPSDYEEDTGYLTKDRIYDHFGDLIAKVEWHKTGLKNDKPHWKIELKNPDSTWRTFDLLK